MSAFGSSGTKFIFGAGFVLGVLFSCVLGILLVSARPDVNSKTATKIDPLEDSVAIESPNFSPEQVANLWRHFQAGECQAGRDLHDYYMPLLILYSKNNDTKYSEIELSLVQINKIGVEKECWKKIY
jgi:hypothetical protein